MSHGKLITSSKKSATPSKLKKTYHSSKDHGTDKRQHPDSITVHEVVPLARKRPTKKRKNTTKTTTTTKPKKPIYSSSSDDASGKDKDTVVNARKKASAYSSYYRDDKKGETIVDALLVKQKWPDAIEGKKVTKETIINQLLNTDGVTHHDAIYKIYGADLVEDKYVRGYLVFLTPSEKNPNKYRKKKTVTPKGFWTIKMPYDEIMSNYTNGFEGLRNKRKNDGISMDTTVEWDDIKKFNLYIDVPPEGSDNWDKKTTRGAAVPLDSRKATDLLIEFDKKIQAKSEQQQQQHTAGGGKKRGSSNNNNKKKEKEENAPKSKPTLAKRNRKRTLSSANDSSQRQQQRLSPKERQHLQLLKENALERLAVMTSDPDNIEMASNMVKDIFILPNVVVPNNTSVTKGISSKDIESSNNNGGKGKVRGFDQFQQVIVNNMAKPVTMFVNQQCPDGVNRFITVSKAKEMLNKGKTDDEVNNAIILDTDSIKNELQRIRCQYKYPVPTHDDLAQVGLMNLRDKKLLESGITVHANHIKYVGDAIEMMAKNSLRQKGIDVDDIVERADRALVEEKENKKPPLVHKESKKKSRTKEKKRKKRKVASPLSAPERPPLEIVEKEEEEENNIEVMELEHEDDEETELPQEEEEEQQQEEEEEADRIKVLESREQFSNMKWIQSFKRIKIPHRKIANQIKRDIERDHGILFYERHLQCVSPVIDALVEYVNPKTGEEIPVKDLPEHGVRMLGAMMKKVSELTKSKIPTALLFYLCYYTFLYEPSERHLPWYVEPPPPTPPPSPKNNRKKKQLLSEDDILGGDTFDFEKSEESQNDDDDDETEKGEAPPAAKEPSIYDDDPVYSKSENWSKRIDIIGNPVARRLCAIADGIIKDGRDNKAKAAARFLNFDAVTNLDEFVESKVFKDPFCFWIWMAFMHNLHLKHLSNASEIAKYSANVPTIATSSSD